LAELGWWGMELANRLVESHIVPIFIVNGARGGTRIDQHQRNDENPTDLDTIYLYSKIFAIGSFWPFGACWRRWWSWP